MKCDFENGDTAIYFLKKKVQQNNSTIQYAWLIGINNKNKIVILYVFSLDKEIQKKKYIPFILELSGAQQVKLR